MHTCHTGNDGSCDDGGMGSDFSDCEEWLTDCGGWHYRQPVECGNKQTPVAISSNQMGCNECKYTFLTRVNHQSLTTGSNRTVTAFTVKVLAPQTRAAVLTVVTVMTAALTRTRRNVPLEPTASIAKSGTISHRVVHRRNRSFSKMEKSNAGPVNVPKRQCSKTLQVKSTHLRAATPSIPRR